MSLTLMDNLLSSSYNLEHNYLKISTTKFFNFEPIHE